MLLMIYLSITTKLSMALEKWLGLASLALFAMFSGLMITVYGFMTDVPDDFDFALSFDADPKILQFISISAAPAGIMGGVAFITSKYYGSTLVGVMLVAGGVTMLAGMYTCHSMLSRIDESYITDAVYITPYLFMGLSAPVIAFGVRLIRHKRQRPKKEYF